MMNLHERAKASRRVWDQVIGDLQKPVSDPAHQALLRKIAPSCGMSIMADGLVAIDHLWGEGFDRMAMAEPEVFDPVNDELHNQTLQNDQKLSTLPKLLKDHGVLVCGTEGLEDQIPKHILFFNFGEDRYDISEEEVERYTRLSMVVLALMNFGEKNGFEHIN